MGQLSIFIAHYIFIFTAGEAYSKLERLNEAEHWYKEALRSKPDHVPAHLTMAKLFQKKVCKVSKAQYIFRQTQGTGFPDFTTGGNMFPV